MLDPSTPRFPSAFSDRRTCVRRKPPSPVPESSTRANRRASENERESEKSNRALRNIYAVFTHFYGAILQVATSKIPPKKRQSEVHDESSTVPPLTLPLMMS
jgi:hypothetical protein